MLGYLLRMGVPRLQDAKKKYLLSLVVIDALAANCADVHVVTHPRGLLSHVHGTCDTLCCMQHAARAWMRQVLCPNPFICLQLPSAQHVQTALPA